MDGRYGQVIEAHDPSKTVLLSSTCKRYYTQNMHGSSSMELVAICIH